jgi:uncharacterized protein YcgL (UPF0745 family)
VTGDFVVQVRDLLAKVGFGKPQFVALLRQRFNRQITAANVVPATAALLSWLSPNG